MRDLKETINNSKIWGYEIFMGENSAWIKLPDCGTCSVIWNYNEEGWEHVSVSPKKRFRIPSWLDMCTLKEVFWKNDEEAYQIHPKGSHYVNCVDNCLHLWKPVGHEIDELVYGKTDGLTEIDYQGICEVMSGEQSKGKTRTT